MRIFDAFSDMGNALLLAVTLGRGVIEEFEDSAFKSRELEDCTLKGCSFSLISNNESKDAVHERCNKHSFSSSALFDRRTLVQEFPPIEQPPP